MDSESIDLGTDDNGVTLRLVEREECPDLGYPFNLFHPRRVTVRLDVWDGADGNHDAASVTLGHDDVVKLAFALSAWLWATGS